MSKVYLKHGSPVQKVQVSRGKCTALTDVDYLCPSVVLRMSELERVEGWQGPIHIQGTEDETEEGGGGLLTFLAFLGVLWWAVREVLAGLGA